MSMLYQSRTFIFLWLFTFIGTGYLAAQQLDFSHATIITWKDHEAIIEKPIVVLKEEIFKRTGITLLLKNTVNADKNPKIFLSLEQDVSRLPLDWRNAVGHLASIGKDGFKLWVDQPTKTILIVGKDPRSVLYGIGRLLRKMEMRTAELMVPANITMSTTPLFPIRGHQLGYRPKTNSYDAFSVAQFDQYIRELALFGANSIEIVPPRTDDDATSKHMKLDPIKMIAEQSRICKSYGLDVWMWYPNMGADYADRKTIQEELKERETVFAAVKTLDAVFVPGGDPGELEPDVLFSWLGKEAEVLQKFHPNARIWVSPQVFRPTAKWLNAFYEHVNRKYKWFGGVVFGPWIKTPVDSIRKLIDPSIPIRIYPDITHSLSSQYPIPDWDLAYAMTLGRECINPRPVDEKHIQNVFAKFGAGSISYSEGTNDDVNKFIWSDQDWDTTMTVRETLEDYARFFVGPDYTIPLSNGILSLEQNLRGPLLSNDAVNKTLTTFQSLEAHAGLSTRQNFRFQMCQLRAYYDAYIQTRLIHETGLEQDAYTVLRNAAVDGSLLSIKKVDSIFSHATDSALYDAYKIKCLDLADSLFKSIGSQLTIKKHGAADGRGNFIDNIAVPLSDAPWLTNELKGIAALPNEEDRIKAIQMLLHRTDPGEGGHYTNFGTPAAKAFIVDTIGWEKDPGGLKSAMVNFGVGSKEDEWVHEIRPVGFSGKIVPMAWMTQTGTLYEQPLVIQYTNLDTSSSYSIQIAYTGRFRSTIKLTAGNEVIHDFFQTGDKPIYNFDLPKRTFATGTLNLTFTCPEGEQGAQVSEIWIIKNKDGR